MKGFKRKLAGFLAFAMVLGLFAPGMTTTVKAADSVKTSMTIAVDLYEETMKIGVSAAAAENFTYQYIELKNMDVKAITSGSALSISEENLKLKGTDWEDIVISQNGSKYDSTIDLSWLSKTKDTALLIKATPVADKASSAAAIEYRVVKFKAQDKNVKVGFTKDEPAVSGSALPLAKNVELTGVTPAGVEGDSDLGYFYFYTKNGTSYELIYPDKVEWKKGTSGNYSEVVNTLGKKMQLFKTKGATLYFQVKGKEDLNNDTGSSHKMEGNENMEFTWPSKEVKYSFKKQAAAPKVTVDPAKTTISVKAGQEYQILKSGTSVSGDLWIPVNSHGVTDSKGRTKVPKLTIFNLFSGKKTTGGAIDTTSYLSNDDIYSGNIAIVVRTAATTKAIPSKQIKLKLDSLVATSTAIKWAFKGATTPEAITVGYKTPTNPASGIEVKNENTTTDYEIAYIASGGSVDASTKWIKVKKAGTKPTVAKLTVAKDVTISTSGSILIRQVGEKANKSKGTDAKLAGDWTEMKLAGLVPLQKAVSVKAIDAKGATVAAISSKEVTIKVAKSAVSGAAVEGIKLEFTYENLGTSPRCSADRKTDGSVAFTLGSFDKTNSKVTLTIDVNKDKSTAPTNGNAKITCDGVETTVKVVIE